MLLLALQDRSKRLFGEGGFTPSQEKGGEQLVSWRILVRFLKYV